MNKTALLCFTFLLTASLNACTLPGYTGAPTAPAQETPLHKTIVADLTQTVSTPHPPPAQPSPSPQTSPTATLSGIVSNQPGLPQITPTATVECNRAAPGNPIDITIPDDSEIKPGQSFSKTWRLKNIGSCTWTHDYAIVWFSGETFGAVKSNSFAGAVTSGQVVDITVDMVAPQDPGTYQSNWKIKNARGDLFGIGPSGDAPFWVRIIVARPDGLTATPTFGPTSTPMVYANGFANLSVNDGLDLDLIQINHDKQDDLLYQVEKDKSHHLTPENGARAALFGKSQPTVDDCQSASLALDALAMDGLSAGTYFCYKTNQSLPGWARLIYLNPQDSTLSLEIFTWSTP